MRLGVIQYGPVQSLGRRNAALAMQDIRLPGAVAASQIRAIGAFQAAAGQIYESYQKAEQAKDDANYNKAWAYANEQEQNLRYGLDNENFIPRAEVQRAGIEIPAKYANDPMIPTHEVYFPYYEARMKEIGNESLGIIERPGTKAKFTKTWGNVAVNQRGVAMGKAIQRTNDYVRSEQNLLYDTHIKAGHERLAEATAAQMYVDGLIDEEELLKRRTEIPVKIDEASMDRVLVSGSEQALEQMLVNLKNGAFRVDDSTAASYATKAITKLDRIERKRDKQIKDWRDRNEATAYEQVLSGDYTIDDLRKETNNYTPEGQRRIADALVRQQKGDGIGNTELLRSLRIQAENVMWPRVGESITSEAADSLRSSRKAWVNGQITKVQYDEIKSTVAKNRNASYRTEDYKTVERNITQALGVRPDRVAMVLNGREAGMSGREALKEFGAKSVAAAQALLDLRSEIRLKGMSLDPLEWWANNKSGYTLQNALQGAHALYDQTYGAVKMPNGAIDVMATRKEIMRLEKAGLIDPVERMRRWNMLEGGEDGR